MCSVALCSATQQLQHLSGCTVQRILSNFIGSKNTNPRQSIMSMHVTVRDRVQTNTSSSFLSNCCLAKTLVCSAGGVEYVDRVAHFHCYSWLMLISNYPFGPGLL